MTSKETSKSSCAVWLTGMPNIFEGLSIEQIEQLFYKAGHILRIPILFETRNGKRNKFLVLLDDKEPPLFFLINSRSIGINQPHELKLSPSDYPFLTKDVSYLYYDTTYETFDAVNFPIPTKQKILEYIRDDISCHKGFLTKNDAQALLDAVKYEDTDITLENIERIVAGLQSYIETEF